MDIVASSACIRERVNCPPCGMGYVPPPSRLLLKFLTQ
jgi:hypothetical protein